ncbi:MAG: rod shape-determining protein MreD [Coxiellaceae bacterium]|jgi:rod shape-determining protein MreD|nr:rod shape-determining protein MreD [Coxiellaceae bacterium]
MTILSLTIKKYCLIFLSFVIGLLLMLLQLPLSLCWLNSLWPVLVLIYWILKIPQIVNIKIACSLGIMIDVITNTTIGVHTTGLILISILMLKIREKILSLSSLQITAVIFWLLIMYQTVILLMQSYVGNHFNIWSILSGAWAGTIGWLLLAPLLSNLQRKFFL